MTRTTPSRQRRRETRTSLPLDELFLDGRPYLDGQQRYRDERRSDRTFRSPYSLVTFRAPEGPLRARLDPTQPDFDRDTSGSGRDNGHRHGDDDGHGSGHGSGERRPMTFASRSSGGRPPGRWRRFVQAYGWRAYAVPVLALATAFTLVNAASQRGSRPGERRGSSAASGMAAGVEPNVPNPLRTGIYVDSPATGTASLPMSALPAGAPYTQQGGNRFDVVPGSSPVFGSGGPIRRFSVEIEAGVAEDGPTFAAAAVATLSDQRSWTHGGQLRLQRVDSGPVDFRVSLTSSLTVRRLCGYTLPYETSCFNGELDRVVINDARWERGAVAYGSNLAGYQDYVINHEVGHALGHDHQPCPRKGAAAPVMMQQTLGLTTAGVGACRPNPWPFPAAP